MLEAIGICTPHVYATNMTINCNKQYSYVDDHKHVYHIDMHAFTYAS